MFIKCFISHCKGMEKSTFPQYPLNGIFIYHIFGTAYVYRKKTHPFDRKVSVYAMESVVVCDGKCQCIRMKEAF